ncbi:hypothetical protein O1Q79_00803 [Lonepinella sp. MS14434]|uniref:Uncharacterized protein n=1 Tax=Lonepinella koalarum TaxID=53417 RepID=A0A4R1KT01_9PAST|nr:hypothetical protein EV692_1949 [Lonepinella koalarum]
MNFLQKSNVLVVFFLVKNKTTVKNANYLQIYLCEKIVKLF